MAINPLIYNTITDLNCSCDSRTTNTALGISYGKPFASGKR